MSVYLDFNATTPIDPEVLDVMVEVYKNHFGNAGSRTHVFGHKANELVTQARQSVAELLKVDTSEVIFTSGATESNNLALLGLASWGEEHGRKHIIASQIEHKSVLEPLEHLQKKGFDIELAGVDASGRLCANKVLDLVRPDTLLVSVMHANNETGIIQPVEEIGQALEGSDIYFHVDAAQTFGKMVDELQALNYDLLSISGHKIFGPQGIGALVMKTKNYKRPPIEPITYGGGQERGLRPGTLPVALIAGLGKASEISAREHRNWHQDNLSVKNSILEQLSGIKYFINGAQDYCMPHVLNISFPGVDSEALMIAVKETYALSNGSACTSQDYKPSHVLSAMGRTAGDLINSNVRLSWGKTKQVSMYSLVNAILALSAEY